LKLKSDAWFPVAGVFEFFSCNLGPTQLRAVGIRDCFLGRKDCRSEIHLLCFEDTVTLFWNITQIMFLPLV